jgi:alpha-beta hydrolase superfamily lysophospholipase
MTAAGRAAPRRALDRTRRRATRRALLAAAEFLAPTAGAWLVARAAREVPARVRSRPAAAEVCGTGPVVYLLDGFLGRGHTLPLVGPLVQAGYQVVSVPVPAHSPDGPGRYQRGIVREFITALETAVHTHGTPYAVIAHSLGGYAAQLAVLGGLPAPRLVLIEAMPDVQAIAAALAPRSGIGPRAAARLPSVLARQAGHTLAELDAASRAREDDSPRRVLAAWDDSSDWVPAEVSLDLALAWGAKVFRTSASGHVGLLKDPELHARVIAHLAASGKTDAGRPGSRELWPAR